MLACQGDACTDGCTAVCILTRNESKLILLHILLGLCYLHKKGIIHNDVKPNNILLNHYKQEYQQLLAVIADFGLSQSTAPTLTTSQRIKKLHPYDAPDRGFSTKIDIWSFGMLAFHLTFVANTRKRMDSSEFRYVNMVAGQQNLLALRNFIGEKLQDENPFFIESLVQCFQINPEFRPTAKVMCEILLGGRTYIEVCDAACTLYNLMNNTSICLEEMIFSQWYKHVFLISIVRSKLFSPELVSMLVHYGDCYDFPLIGVVANYDEEILEKFASVLESDHPR